MAKPLGREACWARYKVQPSFVLGFHGCDESTVEKVISGKEHLRSSSKPYDWLGNGIYFWEGSPRRAMEWAESAINSPRKISGKINKPSVVGAIIDLGACCNLFDSASLNEIKASYDLLKWSHDSAGTVLPENTGTDSDKLLRRLDCAVIEYMHQLRDWQELPSYDTVRAAFGEGGELYPGAAITARNHIQIAVRNPACIKGYFRPLEI